MILPFFKSIYPNNKFNIIIIYITEAHAVDVWPIGLSSGTLNNSHKTIQDRIECSKKFQSTFDIEIPMYCDDMNNDFQNEMSAWPFRFYILQYNKILEIGYPEDCSYEIESISNLL